MSEEKAGFTGENLRLFTIIATVVGAAWVLSSEIHEETGEIRKEIGEIHKEIGELRGDIRSVDAKLDAFIDSHRREHDILLDAAAKNNEENSTSAN